MQYAVAFPETPETTAPEAPLELVLCAAEAGGCGLLQLSHTYDQDRLYERYWYRSGISTTMVAALRDVVASARALRPLRPGDTVLDIGSNDGTLLHAYPDQDVTQVGFEPSNLWRDGSEGLDLVIHDYFSHAAWQRELGDRKARIITSVAMFYDLERPNDFVADVARCLEDDGLWIIQMNYLGGMLQNDTFDNISHEHLEYYSLFSLEHLLSRHGFEVFDVSENDVNGGSFRCYVRKRDGGFDAPSEGRHRVEALRHREATRGLETQAVYDRFAERIHALRGRLRTVLLDDKQAGRTTAIYGASTRGLVVLQYAGIDRELVDFAVDKNPEKWGRYIVGTGIPIVDMDRYRNAPPSTLLVLPYHFKREIALQEADFLRQGGRMIFILPNFDIVDASRLAEFEANP